MTPAVSFAAGAVSQGFKTNDGNIPFSSIVSIKNGSQNLIEAANSDDASGLIGIVADKPLIALDSQTSQAQVVVSGVTTALVSDINGTIKTGDKITASPIDGVGMKAIDSSQVVGIAEGNLSSTNTASRSITDKAGAKQTIHIGSVAVLVNVSYYVAPQDKLDSLVPSFLVNVASSIAGKEVSALRVLISFLLLIIGFVIVGVILQAAIRSDIISIGRNPLAHSALRRSLIDVLLTSLGLLALTCVVFYLILTL